MSNPLSSLSPAFKLYCENRLEALSNELAGASSIVISSTDGFEFAMAGTNHLAVSKLAAMCSSMHALGDAVAREANYKDCRNVMIESTTGNIVMMAIADADLVLLAISESRTLFGTLLHSCRRASQEISERYKLYQ
jgi:hypothetical protein